MNIFKTRLRSRSGDQPAAEHGNRSRAARSRAMDQLPDPMTSLLMRTMR